MKRILLSIFAFAALVIGFQNCESGFHVSMTGNPGSSLATTTPITPAPAEKPVLRSLIFLGGEGFVQSYILNHETDRLVPIELTAVSGQPGWIGFDRVSASLFMPDANGSTLTKAHLELATGKLSVEKVFTYLSHVVHLLLDRHDGLLTLYGSSYNDQRFAAHDLGADGMTLTARQSFEYSSGAHTHSSAIDADSGLMFVANKEENRVVILSRSAGLLSEVGEISIPSPRTVAFDSVFKRLYVVTEDYVSQSRVGIFDVVRAAAGVTVTERQTFYMGLRGAGLSIDHSHGFLVASVRESGREGIWALPLTADGLFDAARATKFISVSGLEARSVDVTADGRYYIVTCNDARNVEDLFIFKISYTPAGDIVSAPLLQAIDAGQGSFLSQLVIGTSP